MIARRPVEWSRQKTTCSWPSRSMPASSSFELQLDEDVVALDLHGEAIDPARGVVEALTCRDIVRPGVQWTGHHGAVELTFAQGAAAMFASIVDRVERSSDVEEREVPSLHLDDLPGAGCEVLGLRHFDERSH